VGVGVSAPLIVTQRLRKVYGDLVAVDDVSFELPPGGSLGIVGESGSGKTTLAKMLVGLERPTSGSIEIAGENCSLPAKSARQRWRRARFLQIVFQDPYSSLDPRQTVGDALREALRVSGVDRNLLDVRARALIDLVGMPERVLTSRPSVLSGGQRQRTAIARALATEPRGLILDESVAALDVSIQAQILNLLADIREQTGVAYVFVSHDLAVVRHVTDEVIVMRGGQIVERGETGSVLDNPQHEYTRLLRASVPRPGWVPGVGESR
jgi:ABC-type glutathione transport system ATPase component